MVDVMAGVFCAVDDDVKPGVHRNTVICHITILVLLTVGDFGKHKIQQNTPQMVLAKL